MKRCNLDEVLLGEYGGVSVDWIVISAAIVGLAVAVSAVVGAEMVNASSKMSEDMATQLNDF